MAPTPPACRARLPPAGARPALALLALSLSFPAGAQSGPLETPADLVWVAIAAALVFFMQAGFAFLESGMARAKNTVNVIMKNYADLCFGVPAFWLVGFGLMFGANASGWFGASHYAPNALSNRDAVFFLFQIMFAATAATIVSGAVAERMRFAPYVIGSMIITGLIYPLFGSWVWGSWFEGKGWLAQRGFVDFAGSTVVHSVGAWCSLAGILVVGPRLGRFSSTGQARAIPGHSLSNVALGAFILWLGWFGFNGGSTLAAGSNAGIVLMNTHMAGACGFVSAVLFQSLRGTPVLLTTTINASIGGLVAITAGCATMTTSFAAVTGLVAGVLVCAGQSLLDRLRLDDVVGALPVHGFCGVWGTLAAGLFYAGDLFDVERVTVQTLGIVTAFLWAFPSAYLMYWLLDRTIGLRAPSLHEQRGLDFTEHYEVGYPEFQKELTHGGKS